ncbi:putative celp0028 effector like protein [Erysiphe neolycopersici]|uniref:Putative celp0028 effector like protein n=1 Tax=Erysiphe neolycopersici TaxID=212602 RepID=A0A420I475_9PEZI|nr:putative celp0028 effector like protein [Erysiphe neolycopersici]
MYFSYLAEDCLRILLIFSIATSVSSATTIHPPSSNIQREITAEELILTGPNGRIEVVSRKEFMARNNTVPIATATQHYSNFTSLEDKESSSAFEKRCQKQTVFTMNPVETFLNWDVPMSPVVLAPPNDTVAVNIDNGFSISEKLTVSGGDKIPIVKDFLLGALSIKYQRSWSTESSVKYFFMLPPGKVGAIVSNPLTIRHSGWMDTGCIGNSKRTQFSGDSYREMVFNQMPWVEGVIGLCIGDTFPLKRCLGNGTL